MITGAIASGTVGVFSIHFIDNISAAGKENANLTDNDSVIAWGAQIELGSFPTSPIVTAGSTVTRNADTIRLASSAFPLGTAYTIYANIIPQQLGSTVGILQLGDGATNMDSMDLRAFSAGTMNVKDGNVSQAGINGADGPNLAVGVSVKLAGRVAEDDFSFFIDGVEKGTDSSGTVPAAGDLDILNVGHLLSHASAFRLNGHMADLVILPRAMDNTELGALTTL